MNESDLSSRAIYAMFGRRRRNGPKEWLGIFVMGVAAAGVLLVLALWTDSLRTFVPAATRGSAPIGIFLFAASAAAGAMLVAGALAWGEAYLATLWAVAPLLPGVASLGIAVIYLASSETSMVHGEAVFTGSVVAVAMWLVSGALLRMLATAPTAQVRSYGELLQRTMSLIERSGYASPRRRASDDATSAPPPRSASSFAGKLPPEVEGDLDILVSELGLDGDPGAGLRYVSASGYMTLWRTVHYAEAALLGADDDQHVIAAAKYDFLRLSNSQIPNRVVLMRDLRSAVEVIDPSALRYLVASDGGDSTPATNGPPSGAPATGSQAAATAAQPAAADGGANPAGGGLPQAIQTIMALMSRAAAWLSMLLGYAALEVAETPAKSVPSPATARAVIKTVRLSINEYRNGRWDELIRARNRLLRTILLAAVAAYVLTIVAIVGRASHDAVAAATAFYFAGGAVGLVARLVAEGKTDSAVDDYGLFEARLLHTPLVGGLAAVFGVVLVAFAAKATAVGTGQDTLDLAKIFTLNDIRGIVTAASFGLAPGLLISGLNDNVTSIKKSLSTSEAAGGPTVNTGDAAGKTADEPAK